MRFPVLNRIFHLEAQRIQLSNAAERNCKKFIWDCNTSNWLAALILGAHSYLFFFFVFCILLVLRSPNYCLRIHYAHKWSANIKLTFHKLVIRSVMTHVCPACETRFAAPLEIFHDTHRSAIFTRLSNLTNVCMYNKLCSQKVEVIQNHGNDQCNSTE
jgi:hypothetical protein